MGQPEDLEEVDSGEDYISVSNELRDESDEESSRELEGAGSHQAGQVRLNQR